MAHEGRLGANEVAKAMSYLTKRVDELTTENKALKAEIERLRAAAGGGEGGEAQRLWQALYTIANEHDENGYDPPYSWARSTAVSALAGGERGG
jgi:regulator of replication initiation timing